LASQFVKQYDVKKSPPSEYFLILLQFERSFEAFENNGKDTMRLDLMLTKLLTRFMGRR
jgi:hypothetical protein